MPHSAQPLLPIQHPGLFASQVVSIVDTFRCRIQPEQAPQNLPKLVVVCADERFAYLAEGIQAASDL